MPRLKAKEAVKETAGPSKHFGVLVKPQDLDKVSKLSKNQFAYSIEHKKCSAWSHRQGVVVITVHARINPNKRGKMQELLAMITERARLTVMRPQKDDREFRKYKLNCSKNEHQTKRTF